MEIWSPVIAFALSHLLVHSLKILIVIFYLESILTELGSGSENSVRRFMTYHCLLEVGYRTQRKAPLVPEELPLAVRNSCQHIVAYHSLHSYATPTGCPTTKLRSNWLGKLHAFCRKQFCYGWTLVWWKIKWSLGRTVYEAPSTFFGNCIIFTKTCFSQSSKNTKGQKIKESQITKASTKYIKVLLRFA